MTKTASAKHGLQQLDEIDRVFATLAHASRRQILTVLRVRGGSMTSGELARRFDCSWPTTTRHLGLLVEAGLVEVHKMGRERSYSLVVSQLTEVVGSWVSLFEDAGTPE